MKKLVREWIGLHMGKINGKENGLEDKNFAVHGRDRIWRYSKALDFGDSSNLLGLLKFPTKDAWSAEYWPNLLEGWERHLAVTTEKKM